MERLAIAPDIVFRETWTFWADFLGTGKPRAKSPEQWVPIAEALAVEHGGVLPHRKWLTKNGFSGMAHVIARIPELFAHIPQDKPKKSPEQWVSLAEAISVKHDGVLPSKAWLKNNGCHGLVRAMRKRPDLFAHIPKEQPTKTPEEWAVVANALAIEHAGEMPCSRWLTDNGFHGLVRAMRIRPELFIHIKQKKPHGHYKRPEELVPIAEALAADNGGALPHVGWLKRMKNGYVNLWGAMQRRPELFAHIPQERRDSKGRLIPDSREEVG